MTLQRLDFGAAWEFANDFVGRWNDHDLGGSWLWSARTVSWEDPLFTEDHDGRNTQLADGVQRARPRAPGLADHARDTAAAGVWSGSPVAG